MADLQERGQFESGLASDLATINRPLADQLSRYIAANPTSPSIPESYWQDLKKQNDELLAIWLLLMWRSSSSRHGWSGDAMDSAGRQWAGRRANAVASSFVDTTKNRLDTAVNEWRNRATSTPPTPSTKPSVTGFEIDQDEIDARVKSILGPDRIVTTAVNEVSNAITDASDAAMDAQGLLTATDVWRTEKDARVCTICSPLEGQPRSVWQQVHDAGPPAHPNCRCWIEYENEGLIRPTGDYDVSTAGFSGMNL